MTTSTLAPSRRSVAPAMRVDSHRDGTGCEDSNVIERSGRIGIGNSIKVATWNCGGLSFMQREMCKDLNYDILLLTETHDKGSLRGSRNFIPAEPAPQSDPYSGVAFLLSDKIAKCVKFSGCCGSRIVYARIQAFPCDLFVIGVYMPHSQRKVKPLPADTLKQLEEIISQVSSSACIVLLGDLNCKLKRNSSRVTGKWCIHRRHNKEGKQFADFLLRMKLVAISTYFQPSRGKSNATYLAKDPKYKPSQIDYIVISSRWATSVTNSKVKWGVTCQRWGRHYDHGLVFCVLKLRIRNNSCRTPIRDFSKLRSDTSLRSAFDNSVQAKLLINSCNTSDPEKSLSSLQKSITEAADAVLPPRRPSRLRKRHVSKRTKDLHQEREKNFNIMSETERKDATKSIWKSSREDYREYLDGILSQMETAERNGNSREITRLTKIISGKAGSPPVMPAKDLKASPITSTEQLLGAWNEFLAKKFASPPVDQHRSREHLVSQQDYLSNSELEEALAALKSNRAPGWDNIPIEAYQHSPTAKNELFRIVHMIWDDECPPPTLVRGIFLMLYKKGDRDSFSNYRAICLLCHAYKLISAIIARRLRLELEPVLPDSQAGFRPARGTRDNVCILKWTVNMILRESREAIVTFIDYTAAFDTESQLFLDEALGSAGVSPKVRRVIQSIFNAASGCVRIRNPDGTEELSAPFNISRGVLQGDIFSPIAFIVGLWRTFTLHDLPTAGITVGDYPHQLSVSSLEYADDAGLLDEDVAVASARITAIATGSRNDAAMEISKPKTKVLHIHARNKVSETMESEVVALKLKHTCQDCERTFPTQRGLSIHRARWCTGGTQVRSRKGSLADKAVQHEKRKQAEAQRDHVNIEGEDLENVYGFQYLGSLIQGDGEDTADVTSRMHMAQARFSELFLLWDDHRLPATMKLRFYRTAVCSIFTHACEGWDMTQKVMKRINGFNSRSLHRITNKSYHSTATTPDFNLILAIRQRRLRYLGHILRMDSDRLVKRCFIAYVRGGNAPPPGSLMMDCENSSIDDLIAAAEDRVGWRDSVLALQ